MGLGWRNVTDIILNWVNYIKLNNAGITIPVRLWFWIIILTPLIFINRIAPTPCRVIFNLASLQIESADPLKRRRFCTNWWLALNEKKNGPDSPLKFLNLNLLLDKNNVVLIDLHRIYRRRSAEKLMCVISIPEAISPSIL